MQRKKYNEKNKKKFKFNWKICLVLIIGVIWLIRIFMFDVVRVSGSSMLPSYEDGDMVFVKKSGYIIQRYDVIVVTDSENGFSKNYIKRVVGLPGDVLQIRDGYVYVNGELLEDVVDIKIENPGTAEHEILVDGYFVLGDNRNNSKDSRNADFGVISSSEIFGKVIFVMKNYVR